MARRTISVPMDEALLARFDAAIDARSPAEYAEDHLPGAISAPVLDDEERARVGTVYKQRSPFEARRLGAALVARNIGRHLETLFADRPPGWRPLVYCWRGGKRSGAMAHVLREVGWEACTLEGGYRAYRRWVVAELERLPARLELRVIHGATGSGKSRLLHALGRAGAQVLDLEALAAHRGSVLGGLPGQPQPGQKRFESALRAALAGLDPARRVWVEGESRKIGQLQVPAALIERMRAAECVEIEAPRDVRVALLLEEYRHFVADPGALAAQLECLAGLHPHATVQAWKDLAARGEWRDFVSRLLAEHYDPAYRRSSGRNYPRLAKAPRFALASADAAAFDGLARALVDTAVAHAP